MKQVSCFDPLCVALALLVLTGCPRASDKGNDQSNSATAAAMAGSSGDQTASTANAHGVTVTGPITNGRGTPFTASAADLPSFGYTEKEFFFEGTASAYMLDGAMTKDGKWNAKQTTEAPFKSRLLVRRPKDASKFNGTVVVEWLNVSASADGDPGFVYCSAEILREGYAYVGVSAQQAGIQGGGLSLGGTGALPLKQHDPERYGTLTHPGDDYSYDMFSQAAQAIRESSTIVLEGLKPERLIAYGQSQPAMRIVTYVNGVHPLAKKFDGFFIHSRGASGLPLSTSAAGGLASLAGGFGAGNPVWIRDDIDEKVFQFQTETDVTGMLAYLPARQPDSDKLRTWEVTGTAHADQFIVDFNASLMNGTTAPVTCVNANNGPAHLVINAALHALDAWMRHGTEPARAEVLQTKGNGQLLTDANGNSLGGVRTPDVDAPISTLSGQPATSPSGAGGSSFWCILFGSTTPFTPEKLRQLYPTHDAYVTRVKDAARKAREAGFLLPPDEKTIVDKAQAAAIPQ